MKNVFILNHVRDTQLCLNVLESFNFDIDVVITSFYKNSEYAVTGHKIIEPCMSKEDINSFVETLATITNNVSVFLCTDPQAFLQIMSRYDRAISRGRTFLIFRPFIKNVIALSMNRTYLDRLIDVSSYWGSNFKIILSSESWLDEKICASHCSIDRKRYDFIEKNKEMFRFYDFSSLNKVKLDNEGQDKVRIKLGIPVDRKVAVISPRNDIILQNSLYKDHDDIFIENTVRSIQDLKKAGYYIVSRSRMDPKTIKIFSQKGRNSLSIDLIKKLNELKLIDKTIDDNEGYPSKVWQVVYASDVVLVADNTSLCNVESVVLEKPVILPYNKVLEKNINNLNPPTREMYRQGLLYNSLSDINFKEFKSNILRFKKLWFNSIKKHEDFLSVL